MKTPPYDGKIKKGTLRRSVTQNERSGLCGQIREKKQPNRSAKIGQIGWQKSAKLGSKFWSIWVMSIGSDRRIAVST